LFVTMHTSHFQHTPDTVDDEGGTAHFTDDHEAPEEAGVDDGDDDGAPLDDTPAESSSASPNTHRTYQSTKASCVNTPLEVVDDVTPHIDRNALPCTSSQ